MDNNRLIDLFYEAVEKNPNKIAVWCDDEDITFIELADKVNRYCRLFEDNGISYKDHVGIPMNNSITSVALMVTALAMGIALVPINPTLPVFAIETAFEYGDVKHIIARKEFYELSDRDINIPGKKFCLEGRVEGTISLDDAVNYSNERYDDSNVDGSELYIITMTSGSTGKPKPISLTQENKYKRAFAHINMYELQENDRILAATPLYHSLAERLVLMPLILGATSILLPRFTPAIWLNCVKEQDVTFTIAVSAQLAQVAELLSSPFVPEIESLRCIVSSSSLLEPHVKNELIAKLKCDFHEMYGTSETSTVTDICFNKALEKKKSVGASLKEVDIHIVNDNMDILPVGEVGEISCKTELLCDGYYGQKDVFDSAMTKDGYFRTGDLGRLDKDGYLYFVGRKKELIITGGINVYPIDVESCILQLNEVAECAVFSYPDERLGEVVAAAVVPQKDTKLKKRTVRVQCAKNLADFQQPHKIFIVDELPKNSLGKLVKGELYEFVKKYEMVISKE